MNIVNILHIIFGFLIMIMGSVMTFFSYKQHTDNKLLVISIGCVVLFVSLWALLIGFLTPETTQTYTTTKQLSDKTGKKANVNLTFVKEGNLVTLFYSSDGMLVGGRKDDNEKFSDCLARVTLNINDIPAIYKPKDDVYGLFRASAVNTFDTTIGEIIINKNGVVYFVGQAGLGSSWVKNNSSYTIPYNSVSWNN